MYMNPYGADSPETDPAAVRRKAILDLMDGPTRTTQAQQPGDTPYTPPAATTFPGAQTATPASAGGGAAPNPYAGGVPATTAAAAPPAAPGDNGLQYGSKILDLYSEPYNRRGGGTGGAGEGALTGASIGSAAGPIGAGAGAAIGAIVGAAKKHALTAPTDFTVQDATEIIKNAYRDMNGGQEISPEELNAALAGQGLTNGRYVGQQGLMGVLGHLGENAVTNRAAGTGATAAGAASTAGALPPAGAAGATTGAAGSAATGPAGAGAASAGVGGGNMGYLEGFEADKFNDPTKSDPKYDFAHIVGGSAPTPASLDALWDQIVQKFPNAKRTGTGSIDFGTGEGSVDVIRAAGEGGKAWHWEPESGASDATAAAPTATPAGIGGLPTSPAATAGLAAPLANNDVLQQIMAEVARIQKGDAPRNAILQQMGLA